MNLTNTVVTPNIVSNVLTKKLKFLLISLEIRYKIIEIILYKSFVISRHYLCESSKHAYYKHSSHNYHNTITTAMKHFRQWKRKNQCILCN